MRKNIITIFVALFLGTFVFGTEIQKSVPAPFTRGVNFSTWLEFKDSDQINPYYITKVDFENVKKMGCDVVRLPVHFEQLSSGSPNYIVAPEVYSILDNVVEWANELQIYVIIDFHNNTAGGSSTPKNIEEIVTKVWGQISKRYAKSGKYIVYEVYNEPHDIDKIKWGKIEEKVIAEIRKADSEHYIIVGGADFNSFEAMKTLPNFKDDKIIYTFHYYDPFLFTHQGATWTDLGRITGIPFPYDRKRMPKLPANATGAERYYLTGDYNYSQRGTEKAVSEFFDQYVKFSLSRNAPVFCGEFGVYNIYADPVERANWYRIVTNLLDTRGIPHTSWDYYGGFGVFKKDSRGLFPQDLDRAVVEAMKLKVPEGHQTTWKEKAFANKDYTIFNQGIAEGIRMSVNDVGFKLIDSELEEKVLEITRMKKYGTIDFDLLEPVDLSKLDDEFYNIVLEAKNESATNFKIEFWFKNSGLKTEYQWRNKVDIRSEMVPNDGQWHKIVIPFYKLKDIGAWDDRTGTWVNGRREFDWTDISNFVISNGELDYNGSLKIKSIRLEKEKQNIFER